MASKTGNPTEKWLSDRDYLIATGRDLIATGRNLIATFSFRSSSNVDLHDIEDNVHCADLGVKRIPSHVVLAQELCVVRL